jgi:hypothetical protein
MSPHVEHAQMMLQNSGTALAEALGYGKVQLSLIQGSSFTAGLVNSSFPGEARVLLSREELTVSMACRLMEDLSHE